MNVLRFIRIGKIPEGYSIRTGINLPVLLGLLRIDKHRLFGCPAAFTWGPMGFGEIDHRHLLTYDDHFLQKEEQSALSVLLYRMICSSRE